MKEEPINFKSEYLQLKKTDYLKEDVEAILKELDRFKSNFEKLLENYH